MFVNSSRVRGLITEQASLSEMQTSTRSCRPMSARGGVSRSEAMAYASEPHDFGLALQQAGVSAAVSNGS